jgi:putative sterol carrier protein
MSDGFEYLSETWFEQAKSSIKEKITPKIMKYNTFHLVSVFQNCPDGKDKYLSVQYKKGELGDIEMGEGNGPSATFKIYGDYKVFTKINQRELNAKLALLSGKVKLKGSKIKALKLASITDHFLEVLSEIPTVY